MAPLNVVFDMSKYDLFRLCEQRYNLRHNLNIGKPGKPEQMERGSLMHVGFETYYEALMHHMKYDDAVTAALSKIREAGVCSTDLDNDVINRCIDVAEENFDYWRIQDQGIVINAVEQPFMYELYSSDNIRLFMAGKIDLVVSDNRYENEPWDHKTYDRTYEVGRMNNQFKNYCTALKSNFLTINKVGFQKTLKPHEKYKRPRLTFDPIILEEWKQNVITTLMNNYLTCVAENKWPMNETSCEKYNRRCEFYEICDASGLPAKNYKINHDYIKLEPWDVTKIMEKSSQTIDREKAKRESANEDESRPQTEEA
ncbi:MAG: PD-(D/E)XK nuclease family protein [Paenisporosarcina sp.]